MLANIFSILLFTLYLGMVILGLVLPVITVVDAFRKI